MGVTPGSYSDNLSIDNRADVAAWAKAIAQSGAADVVYDLLGARPGLSEHLAAIRKCTQDRWGHRLRKVTVSTITDWAMASWRFLRSGWMGECRGSSGRVERSGFT